MKRLVLCTCAAFALAVAAGGCGGSSTSGAQSDGGSDGKPVGDAPAADGAAPQDAVSSDGPPADAPAQQDGAVPQDATPHDGGAADGAAPQDAPLQQDSGASPGLVACGAESCDLATDECCVTNTGTACVAVGTCAGVSFACDGPEDCSTTAPVCCAVVAGANRGASCATDVACRGEQLCHGDTDCASGEKCCGGGAYLGMSLTWCLVETSCPNPTPTPGEVACGTASCTIPEVCCQSFNPSCTAAADCTTGITVACDGPEDCQDGTPVCCAHLGAGGSVSCVADGACTGGMGTGVVCHSTADCPNGQTCQGIPQMSFQICR